jgi:two-component system, NtrC family, response regulator AtoC
MSFEFRVLVVDDEELYAQAIGDELLRRGIGSDLAFTGAEGLARAEKAHYQAILLDHRLPDQDGIRIIPQLLSRQPESSLIMMTAYHTIPNAVQAIRHGAEDYIVKEPSIQPIIDRLLEIRRRAQTRSAATGWHEHQKSGLAGRSPGIVRVIEQLKKIGKSPETTVLLTGETGVGKEVAARYLHQISQKPGTPFIAVDCASLPGNLAESLLFGHEKGAFTGAEQARAGAFEEAGEGTILLDEIGDMGEIQSKLLRVLENRSFQRVGSVKEIPLRARVVAATNQDLQERVRQGSFRQDLYQRLCVFPIHLPPLRERGDDILLLANHFLDFFAGKLGKEISPLSEDVNHRLVAYTYPGNVREVKNIIERAVIMTDSGQIDLKHLPRRLLTEPARTGTIPASIPFDFKPGVDTLEDLEKRMIRHALQQADGVKSEAARLLGISRFQLMRRMERHGLSRKQKVLDDSTGEPQD